MPGSTFREALVLELAGLLRRDDDAHTAATLEGAVAAHRPTVALTIPDRMAILDVLLDAPAGLEELRGVLLAEHVGRKREGLASSSATSGSVTATRPDDVPTGGKGLRYIAQN